MTEFYWIMELGASFIEIFMCSIFCGTFLEQEKLGERKYLVIVGSGIGSILVLFLNRMDIFSFINSMLVILIVFGLQLLAFRYVDKTKMKEELKEAFEKVREINRKNSFSLTGTNGNDIKNILVNDILFIETNKRGCVINTINRCYECSEKINDLETKLEEYGFFKCHKTLLINLNCVEHLDK